MSTKLAVIGFGNIAKAIITPLLEKKIIKPEEIACLVNTKKSFENITNCYKYNIKIFHTGSINQENIWDCPIKLLAVKPQQLNDIKELICKKDSEDIMVSILAGVSIDKLEKKFPNHKCLRAVTNIPIIIGQGLTAISWGKELNEDTKKFIRTLFENSGKVFELQEEYLDIFLALTSSAPATLALIVEALGDGGLSGGLTKKLSEELVIDMIYGTILMLKKSGINTSDLKTMVTSPGGTTISSLRVLEEKGLRSALIESILAARNKSKEFS